MNAPQGAAAASFHCVTGFSVQPQDIVCQCGAQLAYLLRPAHNEPAVNGLETLAAVSGTARDGVCKRTGVCVCVRANVCLWKRARAHGCERVFAFNGPISLGILPTWR